jgi:hypothetical protein
MIGVTSPVALAMLGAPELAATARAPRLHAEGASRLDAGNVFLRGFFALDEHGAGGKAHYTLGDGAQQQARGTATPVGADHYQIRLEIRSQLRNLVRRSIQP